MFKLDSILIADLPHARETFEQNYFAIHERERNWQARTWLIHIIETMNVVANAPNHSDDFTQSSINQMQGLVSIETSAGRESTKPPHPHVQHVVDHRQPQLR